MLAWVKWHPEERDAMRGSWTLVDWMNYVADRAAKAEYRRSGGEDAPTCLRHQGRWRLEWKGKRVTSVTSDALNWIQEEIPWRELLREQDCKPSELDVQARKVAIGYTGMAVKRAQNLKMMWDRYPFREIYGTGDRSRGSGAMGLCGSIMMRRGLGASCA